MPIPDHYAVLGITRTATPAEIRAARRRCLRERHPDAARGDSDATRAVLLAGEVLLDPAARAAYDKTLLGSLADSRFKGTPAAGPRKGSRDLWCGSCHHQNVATTLHYCIYCGAGIGPTPRPVKVTVGHAQARLSLGMSAGCGVLLGAAVGGAIALRLWIRGDLTSLGVALVTGIPALIVGLVGLVYRERFWDRITGFLTGR
jgi:hypothetical protein